MNLSLYTVDDDYVSYLTKFDDKVAQNKVESRKQTRKYVGVLFEINNLKYFVNLSSYKPKHDKIRESLDFIKIENYAVINLNNMIPVIDNVYHRVEFKDEKDINYKKLLLKEYNIIKKKSKNIVKQAKLVYNHKIKEGNDTSLARRCCDFIKLEQSAKKYEKEIICSNL